METPSSEPSFFTRLGMAFSCFSRTLASGAFAQRVAPLLDDATPLSDRSKVTPAPAAPPPAPPRTEASALTALALLQREGRLIDFLQEDVAAFSDAEVGAAARVVHAGSRKVLAQYLTLEPVLKQNDGDPVTVAPGFDAQRIRLTGNITGQPPFRGTLKHHGWVATETRFPTVADTLDSRILAPAEVDL